MVSVTAVFSAVPVPMSAGCAHVRVEPFNYAGCGRKVDGLLVVDGVLNRVYLVLKFLLLGNVLF